MPQQRFEITAPNGAKLEISGDRVPTEAEMREIFKGAGVDVPASSQPETGDPRSLVEQQGMPPIMDVGVGFAKGAANTAVSLGELVSKIPGVSHAIDATAGEDARRNSFDWARSFLKPTNTAQQIGGVAETAAEMLVPAAKGVGAVKAMLPSKLRAGQKFQKVMAAAGDLPVNTEASSAVALRVAELSERGGKMPKAVKDFLGRVTDPEKAALTYREARDFASNLSRLSAREYKRLTPVVAREVAIMSRELNGAIAQTAKQAGKLQDYYSAMREYARASRMHEGLAAAGKEIKRALPWAGTIGAATWLASKAKGIGQ